MSICLYAHFHKQATNCFSSVNRNTMISGQWVLLKPRESSRCCLCTSLLGHIVEKVRSESPILSPLASHTLPACWRGRWALLVPATALRPPRRWLCRRSPGSWFPLPLMCSQVWPVRSSIFYEQRFR